jgi:hypothetical protein
MEITQLPERHKKGPSLRLFPDNILKLPELKSSLNWTIKDRTRYTIRRESVPLQLGTES